jgi:Kdo-III transferase WaaZ
MLLNQRWLQRLAVKMFFPKNQRHIKYYWPLVTQSANETGQLEVYYKQQHLLTAQNFGGLQQIDKKRVFIIGSGPSIKTQKLEKLRDETCILLNGAAILQNQFALNNVLMHIILDAHFAEDRFALIEPIFKQGNQNILLSLGALRAIADRNLEILKINHIFILQNILAPYMASKISLAQLPDTKNLFISKPNLGTAFSLDPSAGFYDGGSVMTIGIQLTAFLGFKDTYLVGFDIGNANQPRFYEEKGKPAKSELLKDYHRKILPFMENTKHFFASRNLKIYNCSPVSLLPYEIIPYSNFID